MPGLGTSVGRGGATTALQSLEDSDAILIMGSSMAEQHPVGFQWVMNARERGCKLIHVDPRFTRTSATADIWVPLRAGTDILYLGAMINYVLQNDKWFRDYVIPYTNAGTILREDFRDTEDLDGLFSGWDAEKNMYDPETWMYEGSPKKETGGETPGHHPAGGGYAKNRGGESSYSNEYEYDETLQHPRCVFQMLKKHFARYTPEMVEAGCGVPKDVFLKATEAFVNASGPREDGLHLLCRGIYASLDRRADHSRCFDSAVAAGQLWPARWRHSRSARARVDSRLDRYPYPVRRAAGLHTDAIL